MKKTIEEQVAEFCTKMWRTSGARFNAQRRMKYRNTMSVFSISVLSIYLIAITVFQKIYKISDICPDLDNHLTFISVVGAVFIIVISLIEWASDFSLKSDQLFHNANAIKDLRLQLEHGLSDEVNSQELTNTLAKARLVYENLTDGKNPNHEPIDDLYFRSHHKDEPGTPFIMTNTERRMVWLKWHFACYGFYLIILSLPLIILLALWKL